MAPHAFVSYSSELQLRVRPFLQISAALLLTGGWGEGQGGGRAEEQLIFSSAGGLRPLGATPGHRVLPRPEICIPRQSPRRPPGKVFGGRCPDPAVSCLSPSGAPVGCVSIKSAITIPHEGLFSAGRHHPQTGSSSSSGSSWDCFYPQIRFQKQWRKQNPGN